MNQLSNRSSLWKLTLGGAVAVALQTSASAQFNDQWVEFTLDNSMLSSGTISDNNNETDIIWGDLNNDNWTDVVIVRKQPFTSTGKRTNILLMNENGVLTNRTSTFATDSSVGGDNGFNTATNDRDVQMPDVNGDGFLDVVTATTLSDGDPKHIGHPRIYMNQGGTGGSWNGLRFENNRFPQLLHFGTGNPQNPRFCSVAHGDLTGNGFPDLFFGDYDSSGAGGAQQGFNEDLNDRCIINNGSGFFTDESQARCTSSMLLSAFGMATEIHDMNGDGRMDVIKDSALNAPQNVRILYNNLNGTAGGGDGFFNVEEIVHTNAPYHIDVADLNNDGRLDFVAVDDFADRFRINTGNDGLGRADFTGAQTFDFVSGGDDGFGSNVLIADLDMDGWNDVLICDVDVDIGGYNRRLHIYHNETTTPGDTTPTLIEERQSSSSTGWIGVVGLTTTTMRGTHDVAVFDIDNDGDNDLIVSRQGGTFVYRSNVDPIQPQVCQTDIGFGGPGNSVLSMCGDELATGGTATLRLDDAAALSQSLLVIGFLNSPVPVLGGTLVPVDGALLMNMPTDLAGSWEIPNIQGGHPASPTLYFQAVTINFSILPNALGFSNALEVQYLP